mgnify:CR=1 FL=1
MGKCVRNHIMVAHKPVVHITKHHSECEWCTPHAHHISIHFSTYIVMAPVHYIPKCDACGTVVLNTSCFVAFFLWIDQIKQSASPSLVHKVCINSFTQMPLINLGEKCVQ